MEVKAPPVHYRRWLISMDKYSVAMEMDMEVLRGRNMGWRKENGMPYLLTVNAMAQRSEIVIGYPPSSSSSSSSISL